MAPPFSTVENVLANFGNETPPEFPAEGPPLVGGNFPFWPFEIPHNVNAPNCGGANAGLGSLAFYGGGQAGGDAANNAQSCLTPLIAGSVYNPKTTYIQQYNLTIQRQLPGNIVITAATLARAAFTCAGSWKATPSSLATCRDRQQPASLVAPPPCRMARCPQVWLGTMARLRFSMGCFLSGNAPIGSTYRLNPNVASWSRTRRMETSTTTLCKADRQAVFQWAAIPGWLHVVQAAGHHPGRYRQCERGLEPADGSLQFQPRQGPTAFAPRRIYAPTWSITFPTFTPIQLSPTLVKGWVFSNIVSSNPAIPSRA